jgi:hypothetical protein
LARYRCPFWTQSSRRDVTGGCQSRLELSLPLFERRLPRDSPELEYYRDDITQADILRCFLSMRSRRWRLPDDSGGSGSDDGLSGSDSLSGGLTGGGSLSTRKDLGYKTIASPGRGRKMARRAAHGHKDHTLKFSDTQSE